jgi:hypothetical protein
MLAKVDLSLIMFLYTSVVAFCWAYETNRANKRIAKLEAEMGELNARLSAKS